MNKIFNKTTKKSGFSLLELFIVILVIWALAASIPPLSFHGKRGIHYSDLRHCFSNQRVLYGALEMYNMDHSEMLVTAFPGREFDDILKLLQDGKYIKEELTSQDNICSYGFVDLYNKGSVFCVTHGCNDIEKHVDEDNFPFYPELDPDSDFPRLKEYNNLVSEMKEESRRRLRKRSYKIRSQNRLKELLEGPAIPLFLLCIIIIYSIYSSIVNAKKKKS